MSSSFATPWTVAHHTPLPLYFPVKNTGVGCHFLLQGIFPPQGSNLRLLLGRQIFFTTKPPGKPKQSLQISITIEINKHNPPSLQCLVTEEEHFLPGDREGTILLQNLGFRLLTSLRRQGPHCSTPKANWLHCQAPPGVTKPKSNPPFPDLYALLLILLYVTTQKKSNLFSASPSHHLKRAITLHLRLFSFIVMHNERIQNTLLI